ncbi:MAG: sugar phosphate isomerase/epimerase [Spirochaetaceae bacterium]|nr:MAG: sugar phosphate isomerase/epimerase [Spirochaetaceae bacterium]
MRQVRFGVTVSEELLGEKAPVLFQGGIARAVHDAADAGYEAVELHIRNPRSLSAAAIATAAADAGVTVDAIGTGLEYSMNGYSLTADDGRLVDAMSDRLREHIDLAAGLARGDAAPVVFVGLCRGTAPAYALREEYQDRFYNALVRIVEHAVSARVKLVLEPVAFYFCNLLNTTAETIEFLKRPGLEPVDLLLDTHHMHIEDPDVGDAFRASAGRVSYVHVSDSNRQSLGSGNIDFAGVAAAVAGIGYRGTVSVEVLPYPDGATAATRSLAELRRVFA